MQFSLRTLLAAAAAVGIWAALWVAEHSWQVGAIESICVAWILASAATLIVHTTGKAKAFWLGVGIQCTLSVAVLIVGGDLFGHTYNDYNFLQMILHRLSCEFQPVLLAWAVAPVVGLLCVLTHWLLIRPPQGPQE